MLVPSGNRSFASRLYLAAAMVDAIGRRICSGSKLCLPFGSVGSLVAKDRRLSFTFAERFRRPKTNAAAQVRLSSPLLLPLRATWLTWTNCQKASARHGGDGYILPPQTSAAPCAQEDASNGSWFRMVSVEG